MKDFTAVVLAAGRGRRMKSAQPKALQPVAGKPLIYYVLRELDSLKKYVQQIIVVLGHKGGVIEKEIRRYFPGVSFVYQNPPQGTAHAVRCVEGQVRCNNVLVLCSDTPLIRQATLAAFIASYFKQKASCSLITAVRPDENDLGKIIRDRRGRIAAIKEKIKGEQYTQSKEINSGIYAFSRDVLFPGLKKIKKNKVKQEYFLTDIIRILYNGAKDAGKVSTYVIDKQDEVLGINSQQDCYYAEKAMQKRIITRLLEQGVKIIDAATTFIEDGVEVGEDTVIYPFTFIEKDVIIGRNCRLGPFLHLRSGTAVGDNTQLGNFIEVNRSQISGQVTMKHFG